MTTVGSAFALGRLENAAREGSAGGEHPVGGDYPDEAVRYGDDERPGSESPE